MGNDIWYVTDIGNYITIGERGKCPGSISNDGKPIWHTHPKIVKYYLSTTDITKCLTHPKVNESYIFTQHGVWKISWEVKLKNYNDDLEILDQYFKLSFL